MTIRVCDKPYVEPGYMIRSATDPEKIGVIVFINYDNDAFTWIWWVGEDQVDSGFYGNDCPCEYVTWFNTESQEFNSIWMTPLPQGIHDLLVEMADPEHYCELPRRPRRFAMLNT